jgi:hypothetical protein
MSKILMLAGFTISVVGLLIEGIGVTAMTFYPVRRRLRMSPFSIVSIGGLCFCGGILFALAVAWLAN